jgi:hypothetical protein
MFNRLIQLSCIVAVTACTPHYGYDLAVTTTTPVTAKPQPCEFQVVSLPPSGDYEEIGTLDTTGFGAPNVPDFKRGVEADVCRVGGDVVVTQVNGKGEYVRGIVLRKRAAPAVANP